MSRHILLIIEGTFPWYRGGVSEWVDRYIKHCSSCTFSIVQIVLPPYFGGSPSTGIYPIRDRITDFKQIKPPDMSVTADPEGQSYLDKWLSENYISIEPLLECADIIHAANTGFAGLLGAHIKEIQNLPLVVTEHAVYWKEVDSGAVALECGLPVNPSDDDVKSNISNTFRNIATTVYKKADCTVSVARSNMLSQQRLGAEPVKYIPNGVDAELLNSIKLSNTKNEKLTIGWAGRCAHIKQPLRFIELAKYINRYGSSGSLPEVSYEMYLSQAGEEKLEEDVADRASGIPNLQLYWNAPAKTAMRHFDALCITSISEAQPLVVLEAIAAKALPFGWKCGDLDSELGYFFPRESSIAEMAEALIELWHNPKQWLIKVEQLFEKVNEDHLWHEIFRQYEALFDTLTAQANSKGKIREY